MYEGTRKRGKSWSYYFDAAKVGGERKKIEKGGFRTQKEAYDARINAMAEYKNTGRAFKPNEMSVADYLDYWLENAIRLNIDHGYSYNTYLGYERNIRLHLKPAFGSYRLSSFQYAPDIVQKWVDEKKRNAYSKNMVKNMLGCLSGAMNYAITPLRYIQNNPCASVKTGKFPVNEKSRDHNNYIIPKNDLDTILERFPITSGYYLSLIVPYNIGTRIGETFAIDIYEDIDFDNHTISINKQIMNVNKTWFFKAPKYDSFRNLKIGKCLEQELKKAIKLRKENQLKYGQYYMKTYLMPDQSIAQYRADMTVPYKEIHPLCVTENGSLLTPESFKYCAKQIHYDLNLPLFHAHCLRHTHGTILAENGVSPKTVMERLGHKNIETTLRTYVFNTDKMQNNAVDVFENAVNQ